MARRLTIVAVLALLGTVLAVGSDHIDGPRTTADPAADLTDLYAFRSPAQADRTVLVANVFPFAGDAAFFSNAVNYTIAMRPVQVVGLGTRARFQAIDPEVRFTCQFEALEAQTGGGKPRQRGGCTLPGDRKVEFVVGDDKGVSTGDGVFRVFAGLRSDPFYAGWGVPPRTALPQVVPNIVQENNTLGLVIEFDTTKVLAKGTLFGVIAETTPRAAGSLTAPPRIDWVGRPEVTNFRLKVQGEIDMRDLWNQETPFAVNPERAPMYRDRLLLSLELWDKHDGKVDWTPEALRAHANVLLDDFLLIDVAKPTADDSHLEIERSTIEGTRYTTGGGRTLDADVMDTMIAYLVNRGREPIRGGATAATQPAGTLFPYEKPPNTKLLSMARTADLAAGCDQVWKAIGRFDGNWHPLIARLETVGTGVGQLRKLQTADGAVIVERLERLDNDARFVEYSLVSGLPMSDYASRLSIKDLAKGCQVEWRMNYRLDGQAGIVVQGLLNALLSTGLAQLERQFGAIPEVKQATESEVSRPPRATAQAGAATARAMRGGVEAGSGDNVPRTRMMFTSGAIAVANLESSTRAAWNAYETDPARIAAAETVVDQEAMRTQFLGTFDHFDRLADVVANVLKTNPQRSRAHLLAARFDASLHRFADARAHLERAASLGASVQELAPVQLSIWQATGTNVDELLVARRKAAEAEPSLSNLALLATALIDAGRFDEADATFERALLNNRDVSPFPIAWVCFQRGVLWGERAATPDRARARYWYEKALEYLPDYTQARVHLAELFTADGDLAQAEALLAPARTTSNPEVSWRLAEVLTARGNHEAAHSLRLAAKTGYERLLRNYELAFADHAAEFYLGIGNEPPRALALARRNLSNRGTTRALALALRAAVRTGDLAYARALEQRLSRSP